jgi:hypothetical protein
MQTPSQWRLTDSPEGLSLIFARRLSCHLHVSSLRKNEVRIRHSPLSIVLFDREKIYPACIFGLYSAHSRRLLRISISLASCKIPEMPCFLAVARRSDL